MPDCNMPCSDYKKLLNENLILKQQLEKKMNQDTTESLAKEGKYKEAFDCSLEDFGVNACKM